MATRIKPCPLAILCCLIVGTSAFLVPPRSLEIGFWHSFFESQSRSNSLLQRYAKNEGKETAMPHFATEVHPEVPPELMSEAKSRSVPDLSFVTDIVKDLTTEDTEVENNKGLDLGFVTNIVKDLTTEDTAHDNPKPKGLGLGFVTNIVKDFTSEGTEDDSYDPNALDLGSFPVAAEAGEEPDFVSWRMDPKKSLADWTIHVDGGGRKNQVYNVHKCFLGAGPRSSQHFARLFMKGTSSPESSEPTKLAMEDSAANAFPAMLDFIYDIQNAPVQATTESAVALRYLASQLGVKALFSSVNDFIQNDLSVATAPMYLSEAILYEDNHILKAASRIAASDFENLDEKLFQSLPVDLVSTLLSSVDLNCSSESLSTRVATYLQKHPKLDRSVVNKMTDPKIMPTIHPDSALVLLQQALKHPLVNGERKNQVKSLKSRCIKALSSSWDSPQVRESDIESDTKNEVYESSLDRAKETMDELKAQLAASEQNHAETKETLSRYQAQYDQRMSELDQTAASMDKAQESVASLQSQVATLQTQLEASKNDNVETQRTLTQCVVTENKLITELRDVKQDLGKFVRVPELHDIQAELTTYDGTRPGRQPDSLPTAGQHSDLGYVFRFYNKDHGWKTCPVFYYID